MACTINRNKEGKITSVQTESGQQSKLFQAIHANPFLAGTDTSLELYSNAYSSVAKRINDEENLYDTGEPKLFYKSENGKTYDSLEELLINQDTETVTMGFRDTVRGSEKFLPIGEFNTVKTERNSFIRQSIKEGKLHPERVLMPDGSTRFQGKGEFRKTKFNSAHQVKFDHSADRGRGGVKVFEDGTLTFPPEAGFSLIQNQDGSFESIRTEDIPEIINTRNPLNKVELMSEYIADLMVKETEQSTVENTDRSAELLNSMNNFLTGLGFTTTTLENYRQSYKNRHGNDPDVKALADMANKVVAFSTGEATIEQMSEEVAHVAIEFYSDQNVIASALSNVHVTQEYKMYSEFYRNKYSQFYTGVELEEQVRKEVLGKILRNEFIDRFSKEGKTEQRQTLIDRVFNMFQEFVNSIRNKLRPQHIQDLQNLTRDIADNVLRNQESMFDPTIESANVFYDAMDSDGKRLEENLRSVRAVMENMFRGHLREKVPNQAELDKVTVDMEEVDIVRSLNSMAFTALSQAKIVRKASEEASKAEQTMEQTDVNRFASLEDISNILNDARAGVEKVQLKDKRLQKSVNEIVDAIRETREIMDNVRPEVTRYNNNRVSNLVDSAIKKSEVTEKEEEQIRANVEAMNKDQSILGKWFGLMSKSRNPILNLIAKIVKDMNTRVNRKLLGDINNELNEIDSKGLVKYQEDILQKDDNGKFTHYYRSPVRLDKQDADRLEEEVRLIKEITGKEESVIRNLLAKNTASKIIGNVEGKRVFDKSMREWQKEHSEQRRTAEYEAIKQQRYGKDGANVSEETQELIATKSSAMFRRNKKYEVNGSVDQSKKTETEKLQDAEERRSFLTHKDPYYAGEVREGLKVVRGKDLTAAQKEELKIPADYDGEVTMIADGYGLEDLPTQSRTSLDLFNLDMLYMRERAEKGSKRAEATQFYTTRVEELDQSEDGRAYDWVRANSTFALSDAFYESMNTGVDTFEDLVEKFIKETGTPTDKAVTQAHLEEYRELKRSKKSILKKYRNSSNPIEIDSHSMSKVDRDTVSRLDEEIRSKGYDIGLPQEYYDQAVTAESISERDVNEDFEKMRIKKGMSVFEFAKLHMSDRNRVETDKFADAIRRRYTGRSTHLKGQYEDFVMNLIDQRKVSENLPTDEFVARVQEEYAKTKVPSYFQRYEPKGYAKAMDAMKSGAISMTDVINRNESVIAEYPGLKYLEVRPDYTWTTEVNNTEFNNNNYKQGEYFNQPKLFNKDGSPRYLNKKGFFDYYGISVDSWIKMDTDDISQLTATKNKESFELLKIAVRKREEVLEEYGDTERVSKYQRPQISRTKFEVGKSLTKGNLRTNLNDMVRDVFQDRVDEKEFGERIDEDELMSTGTSSTVRIIPKYYQQKLESPDIVSTNVIQAMYSDQKQAMLYRERMKAEGDLNALRQKLSQQRIESGGVLGKKTTIGKKGQTSNFEDKADEYLDSELYGIKQSVKLEYQLGGKTVNLTKAINFLQGWTRFSNLAYNFVVDTTSLTTGLTVNSSDRFSQEFYHRSSARRADRLATDVFKYIAEEGKLNKTSEMNHLLELFGVQNVDDRIKNSNFGRAVRLMDSSPYLVSKISNMGIKPNVLLSTLTDYRYIDGRFRSFPGFVSHMRAQDKSMKMGDIEALFKQAKGETLYDHLEISKTGITYNQKMKDKFENPEEAFQDAVEAVSSKVETMIQIVDTVISPTDRTMAQRNVLANTLMMHKGWAPINATKRFQKRYVDFATGKVSEGHYNTLGRFFRQAGENAVKNRTVNFKELWQDLSFDERSNLKRVGFETGLLAAIAAFGVMLFGADDDDDSYMEDMMQYVYLRTSSEYNSANIFGMGKSLIGIAKSPITAISTVEMLEPVTLITNLFSFNTDTYSKMTKRLSPYKRLDQWADPQEQMKSYWYFNGSTIPFYHPLREERRQAKEESEALKKLHEEASSRMRK